MGVSAATIFAASPTVTALTFQRSESPQKSLADSWGVLLTLGEILMVQTITLVMVWTIF